MQIKNRAVIGHVVTQGARDVELSAFEDFLAATVQGAEFLRHFVHDLLDQAKISVFYIRQLDLAQQFFAQALTRDIGVQQKLLLNIVTHLLAQEISARFELLAQTARGHRRCLTQIGNFLVQIGNPIWSMMRRAYRPFWVKI